MLSVTSKTTKASTASCSGSPVRATTSSSRTVARIRSRQHPHRRIWPCSILPIFENGKRRVPICLPLVSNRLRRSTRIGMYTDALSRTTTGIDRLAERRMEQCRWRLNAWANPTVTLIRSPGQQQLIPFLCQFGAFRVTEKLPDSAQLFQQTLKSKGIDAQVVVLPRSTRTAKEAAAAIGCEVEQIAKSLVFQRTDTKQPVLVIASGSNRVDEQLVSTYLNAKIVKADADFVRSSTGFAIGGIPPLGHKNPMQTLIDQDLLRLDPVWAAAGTPHAVFSVSPHELVAITDGHVIAVSSSTP